MSAINVMVTNCSMAHRNKVLKEAYVSSGFSRTLVKKKKSSSHKFQLPSHHQLFVHSSKTIHVKTQRGFSKCCAAFVYK